MFISGAEAAAKVEDCVVIIQRKCAKEFFQLFEPLTDLRWVGFVGFSVGLVKLIQDGFVVAVTGVNGWVSMYAFNRWARALSMVAPPGSLEPHQKLVDGIRAPALLNQFITKVEQPMEH